MASPELLNVIRKYRELDSSIKKINKNLTDMRDTRGELEKELKTFFEKPEYSNFHKMDLSDDSYIRIQRPGEWKKAWTLSKEKLQTLLTEFTATGRPVSECYSFIVEEREKTLVGDSMQFTRLERS
jgi:hypothetical protein